MSTAQNPLKQQIKADGVTREKLPGRGHGLVAAQDFSPRAQVLFVQRPLILALESSRLQSTCYACLRSEDAQVISGGSEPEDIELKTCTGCWTVRFCNKACQKHAWTAYHKYECKLFAKMQPRVLPPTVRAVTRLLLQHKHGLVTDDEWEQLASLESHQEDLSNAGGDRWQDLLLMTKGIQKFSSTTEPLDTIVRICCTMMVNSFALTTPTFDPVGIALYPLPASMNHSCDPNVIVRFDITSAHNPVPIPKVHHGSISVQALRSITKGEELRITYIDATMGFAHRQSDLLYRYFFKCDCPLCVLGPPHASTDRGLQSAISAASKILTKASKPSADEDNHAILSQALSSLAKAKTSPKAQPNAGLRHELVLSLIAVQDFEAALNQNLVLVFLIDPTLYAQPHHPSRLVSKWRLFRLSKHCLGHLNSAEQATHLSMLACLLLDELLQTVLDYDDILEAGGNFITAVAEDNDDGTSMPTSSSSRPLLGQFELMVFNALLDMTDGDAKAAWFDWRSDRGFWRRKIRTWTDGVIRKLLRQEAEGNGLALVNV